ncbi:MAG TPA: hydrogenase maturation protease [Symbiobacteriaceae bacterium]
MGIGNSQRGDDRAGPRVARLVRRLARVVPDGPPEGRPRLAGVLVAETTPEAYAGAMARLNPDVILLVDAVDLGGPPGEAALLDGADLSRQDGWEVHRPPLALLMRYLTDRTGARVLLLGIQAVSLDWGEPMTPAVRQATGRVVRTLLSRLEAIGGA